MNCETSIRCYLAEARRVMHLVNPVAMAELAEVIIATYDNGNQIFTCGNGGSAAAALHFACDLAKHASPLGRRRLRAYSLNANISTITAIANDLDYRYIFSEQLSAAMEPGDLLIAISCSGNSENVLAAVEYAREHGARTAGLSGFDGGSLALSVDYSVNVPVHHMQHAEDLHLMTLHNIYLAVRAALHQRDVLLEQHEIGIGR
ncbi:SIS domain-containing protein [bacterium]|nr:SIS domain-containing protein [candidate division CSSED10-310 bacterium]